MQPTDLMRRKGRSPLRRWTARLPFSKVSPPSPARRREFVPRGIMRLSAYFMPTLKETPAEAQIVSHRLMLRAGMVRQASAGIYSWLPLGLRVLKRIEQIVREEQDRAG